jgi:gluconate 2-dehydrogenase gamma chain
MNGSALMTIRRPPQCSPTHILATWREKLVSRRAFLLTMAGGSLAALMPLGSMAGEAAHGDMSEEHRWAVLDAVQVHLFPTEENAPGAREIKALDYLRLVVQDQGLDPEERRFILRGVGWLEDLAHGEKAGSFLPMSEDQREALLRRIASSEAGENWLSTIQLYICEALLADPVYGGNPHGVGWKWLGHNPGFPRPAPDRRYGVA